MSINHLKDNIFNKFYPLSQSKGLILKMDFLNNLLYIYKRNKWILDIKRYWKDYKQIDIEKPIFLLGTHGGGLTLISRMLRRNKKMISVTGNHNYWSGADEMQVVYGPILPKQLAGINHKVPNHPNLGTPRGWLYATDELIDKYRNNEKDVSPQLKEKFKKIIRWTIYRNRKDKKNNYYRFTDKSQVYTVKVAFINELLKEHNPKFILITRNPYAICYRSAKGKAGGLKAIEGRYNFMERLQFASEHWANSMEFALKDKEKVNNFLIIRFEDILRHPEKKLKMICDFSELNYNSEMLPQPHHKVPFGSRFKDRWYPLRPEVNEKYFKEMSSEHVNLIANKCETYAKKFNYVKPTED
ncbi:MAG: sulfotransferase family protein [archaeon]